MFINYSLNYGYQSLILNKEKTIINGHSIVDIVWKEGYLWNS